MYVHTQLLPWWFYSASHRVRPYSVWVCVGGYSPCVIQSFGPAFTSSLDATPACRVWCASVWIALTVDPVSKYVPCGVLWYMHCNNKPFHLQFLTRGAVWPGTYFWVNDPKHFTHMYIRTYTHSCLSTYILCWDSKYLSVGEVWGEWWAELGWAGPRQRSLGSTLFVTHHHKSVMYAHMHSVVDSLYHQGFRAFGLLVACTSPVWCHISTVIALSVSVFVIIAIALMSKVCTYVWSGQ